VAFRSGFEPGEAAKRRSVIPHQARKNIH
jgi:hypothetical protein